MVILGRGEERLAEAAAAVHSVHTVLTVEDGPHSTGYDRWLDGVSDDDPGFARDPGETALMFYTSGTTGRLKGIELTGANLGQAIAAMHYLLELDTDAVALAPVPFFHVSGLGLALVAALNGAALLLRNPTSPDNLCRILQEEKVTHAVAVPTVTTSWSPCWRPARPTRRRCGTWSTAPPRCPSRCCARPPRCWAASSCRATGSPSPPAG